MKLYFRGKGGLYLFKAVDLSVADDIVPVQLEKGCMPARLQAHDGQTVEGEDAVVPGGASRLSSGPRDLVLSKPAVKASHVESSAPAVSHYGAHRVSSSFEPYLFPFVERRANSLRRWGTGQYFAAVRLSASSAAARSSRIAGQHLVADGPRTRQLIVRRVAAGGASRSSSWRPYRRRCRSQSAERRAHQAALRSVQAAVRDRGRAWRLRRGPCPRRRPPRRGVSPSSPCPPWSGPRWRRSCSSSQALSHSGSAAPPRCRR